MEAPTESGSDEEFGSNSDLNDTVNQPSLQEMQNIVGTNSCSDGASQTSLPKSNAGPSRSRSRSPIGSINTSWKSTNAFINFLHTFKQTQNQSSGKMVGSNMFRLGGEKWRLMSKEEKQPYINAAHLARQAKAVNSKKQINKRPQRLKSIMKYKKDDSGSKNDKKEPKQRGRKRKKTQGIFLKVTDSEDGSDSDNKSSDISF